MTAADQIDLEGRDILLAIDEPFELIAENELVVAGRIVDIVKKHDIDILRIELTTRDPRLPTTRFAWASARRAGESVLSLAPALELWVHGSFHDDESEEPRSGFMGRLRLAA